MGSHLQRHRLDTAALVFGIIFGVEGLVALGQQAHWIHLQGRTWFGVLVMAVGLAGAVVVGLSAWRHREEPASTGPSQATGSAKN